MLSEARRQLGELLPIRLYDLLEARILGRTMHRDVKVTQTGVAEIPGGQQLIRIFSRGDIFLRLLLVGNQALDVGECDSADDSYKRGNPAKPKR